MTRVGVMAIKVMALRMQRATIRKRRQMVRRVRLAQLLKINPQAITALPMAPRI